jgi:nucleotide-binding universal stress UspA family protein
MKNVLVPLDGTQEAEKVLPVLQQVCAQNDSVVLFSVRKPAYPTETGTSPGRPIPEMEAFGLVTHEVPVFAESEEQSFASQVAETRDYLERLAGPLRKAGINVRTDVSIDDRADEAIIQLAQKLKPTFIALSRSTRLRPNEKMFGSVATRVVESAVAPILLVPTNR